MDEKILTTGKPAARKSTAIRYFLIPVILLAIFILYYALDINGSRHASVYFGSTAFTEAHIDTYELQFTSYLVSAFLFETATVSVYMSVVLYLFIIALVYGVVNFLKYKDMAMTITDKWVYGVSSFGKRVDLPLPTISSVSASGKRNINLLTPSGKILFGNFENTEELFQTISRLLVERQG